MVFAAGCEAAGWGAAGAGAAGWGAGAGAGAAGCGVAAGAGAAWTVDTTVETGCGTATPVTGVPAARASAAREARSARTLASTAVSRRHRVAAACQREFIPEPPSTLTAKPRPTLIA